MAANYFDSSDLGIPEGGFGSDFDRVERMESDKSASCMAGGGVLTGLDWFSGSNAMQFPGSSSSVFDSPEKNPINDLQAEFRSLNLVHPNLTLAQLDLLTPNNEEPALNPWDYYKGMNQPQQPTPLPFTNYYAYNQHRSNSFPNAATPQTSSTTPQYYHPDQFADHRPISNHGGAIPKRPILAPIVIPPPAPQQSLNLVQPTMASRNHLQSPPLLSPHHINDLLTYLHQQENSPDLAMMTDNAQRKHSKWFDNRPEVPPASTTTTTFEAEPKYEPVASSPAGAVDPGIAKTSPKFSLKFIELLLQLKKMTEIGLLDRDLLDQPLSPVTLSMIYNIVVIEKKLDDLRKEAPLNFAEQEMNLRQREDVLRKEIRFEQGSYLASMKSRMHQKQHQPFHHQPMAQNLPRKW